MFLRLAESPAPARRPASRPADPTPAERAAVYEARDAAERARTRAEAARDLAEAARDVAQADADRLGEQVAFLQEQIRSARAYHVDVVDTERATHHAERETLLQEMATMAEELHARSQRVGCHAARRNAV